MPGVVCLLPSCAARSLGIVLTPPQWGPYRDAVFPGLWMNEGGQSSTGQLIDFVMSTHPAYPKLLQEAKETGKNTFVLLGERLDRMRKEKGLETASAFARLKSSTVGRGG